MSSDDGYSSVTVMILVLFLSSIIISILLFLRISQNQANHQDDYFISKSLLEKEVQDLIQALADDPTPEADSQFDPVWLYLENREYQTITLTLEDLSSRFNLNFMRTKMLEQSTFKELLTGGYTPEDLKFYRGEQGFFSDVHEGYDQFFDEDVLDKYFTAYSYTNLNVTYEDSLKKLYEIRVSEEGSLVFLNSIRQLISSKVMADDSKMKMILGIDFDVLYPLINTQALLNVNFVDEKILNAVIHYPYGGEVHKNSSAFYEILKAERSTMEIDSEHLKSVLAVEEDYLRMFEYLGSVTWFWRITAVVDDLVLNVVISRFPGDNFDNIKFQILEWNFQNVFVKLSL